MRLCILGSFSHCCWVTLLKSLLKFNKHWAEIDTIQYLLSNHGLNFTPQLKSKKYWIKENES